MGTKSQRLESGDKKPAIGKWGQKASDWKVGTKSRRLESGDKKPAIGKWGKKAGDWKVGKKSRQLESGEKKPAIGKWGKKASNWKVGKKASNWKVEKKASNWKVEKKPAIGKGKKASNWKGDKKPAIGKWKKSQQLESGKKASDWKGDKKPAIGKWGQKASDWKVGTKSQRLESGDKKPAIGKWEKSRQLESGKKAGNWKVGKKLAIGHRRLLPLLLPEGKPVGAAPNVMQLVLAPGLLRPRIRNWDLVAHVLGHRVRRRLRTPGLADERRRSFEEWLAYPDVERAMREAVPSPDAAVVIPLDFVLDEHERPMSWFSTIATLGTPQDVTLDELLIETLFPADDDTDRLARELAAQLPGDEA